MKLSFPDNPEVPAEAETLRLVEGDGMVRLLEWDQKQGALLLERCEPGTLLSSLVAEDDARATTMASAVMRRPWRPAPAGYPFKTVTDWGRGFARLRAAFDGTSGPLPSARFEEAERLFTELCASMAEPVLLHGDLHHENILAARRQPWLAIDPKGVIGEPAYETGALLRNQLFHLPDPQRVTARRIDQLSGELGLDRERIRQWALAQAVLSAVWTAEDHGQGWEEAMACADLLATL